MDQGLYIAAIPYFEEAIELAPEDQEGYVSKIKALHWGKRYYRCVEFGEKADQLTFERNADIAWFIGDSQYQLGNYEQAVIYLKQATDRNPDDPELGSGLARAYLALEDDAKAVESYKIALKLNPENWMALNVVMSNMK
ncbi:tetratricopeptide repeat protein [Paenibacillus sp. GM2]|uniref:tetratricopeptide repeat protein n=1 Tax=Paenibacillus sp. GM2 TaxID=1622070 RepID=UPI0008391D13|nr:tetratricopeptide repeat protein [Paenibacillus sp. GM2]